MVVETEPQVRINLPTFSSETNGVVFIPSPHDSEAFDRKFFLNQRQQTITEAATYIPDVDPATNPYGINPQRSSPEWQCIEDEIVEIAKDVMLRDDEQRKAQGNDAFALLYQRWYSPICHYLFAHGVYDNDAMTNEVFTKALEALPRYKKKENTRFSAWLFKIASNSMSDQHRNSTRKPALSLEAYQMEYEEENIADIIDVEEEAIDSIVSADLSRRVSSAIEKLHPTFRRLINLSLQEMSYEEMGSLTGKSVDCIKVSLHRARHNLRVLLGEDLES